MNVTAKSIADRLGVSPSTVSLVMNGKSGVSEATRERILTEAIRLGYSVPKKTFPAVTQNIRYVIFLEGGDVVKETSFYSIVLQGIEAKAKEYGYNVSISYFYSSGDWAEQISAICKDMAGLIILATEVECRHIEKARLNGMGKQNIPAVLVDNTTNAADIDCVIADNMRGAYKAVSYLMAKGHPDVGYLCSKNRINSFNERQEGVLKARKENGADGLPLQSVSVGISSEQAYYDMCAWLDGGGRPLSAFFADNDIIAAACIRALKSRGYRIPEDVSVVGFDDMPVCTMIDPTLTTIRVMKELMGMTAMNILHQRILDGEHALTDQRIGVYHTTISTHLVERDSTIMFQSDDPAPESGADSPMENGFGNLKERQSG